MKKAVFYLLLIILCAFSFAEEMIRIDNEELMNLSDLNGIWENDSRFLLFNTDKISFILKPFYRFYYDETDTLRAGLTTGESGETVLRIKYTNSKKTLPHPICVINDKLFLDFFCYGSAFLESDETDERHKISPLYGYWRAGGNVDTIELAVPHDQREVTSYYFTDTDIYFLRYWRADVPYDKVAATVTDGDFSFEIDKFLMIGDTVYTCVTGRGTKVRYFSKYPYSVNGDTITIRQDDDKTFPLYVSHNGSLLSLSEPYLTKSRVEDLPAEIAAHNSLRHFPIKPWFKLWDLDFHWEEIEYLRNGRRK